MKFKRRTLDRIADMICGNFEEESSVFVYRSSSYLTDFFQDSDTDYCHDGSTRKSWVATTLETILKEPQSNAQSPPDTFLRVVETLMDQGDANNEGNLRPKALAMLNTELSREGYEAFFGEDRKCYLRHILSKTISGPMANPHRPFSKEEILHKEQLVKYMNTASEDDLIDEILLPMFRQLGFQKITVTGHKDKALEYGKDIWMRFVLPTQHVLYFGIQVKKGKLDSAGVSRSGNSNIAEILNQVTMMLGHEIFDPEVSRRVLVDHAFIIAGGDITKAAKNWLAGKLDASKRSQILFMDREEILDLCVVNNIPLPKGISSSSDVEIPF
ncbi:MAG: hypothetical protein COB78_02025 [Hyphomicrobiales bacterium]|nr:MAG: hypothetical protein COB78_02025 [Hyphomicrobiales bacterium]